MSKVWRRLQRVGKKASKYRFATYSHNLTINCNTKCTLDKICITWTHRNRKVSSKLAQWEPGLTNVYEGSVQWDKSSSDMVEFDVTLYKSINEDKYEEKEWVLMVEGEDSKGKRKLLATGKLNVEEYASIEPQNQKEIKDFKLKIISKTVKSMSLSFIISSQFIKDGKATDEDMISVASFMSSASTNNPYLNSNVMFDKKHNDKYDSSYEDEQENSNTKSDLEIDEDNIEYYLRLQANQSKKDFDSISQHFSQSTDVNQNDTIKPDFQASFLKIFDQNTPNTNSKTNNTNVSNSEKVSSSNKENNISKKTESANQQVPIIKVSNSASSLNSNTISLTKIQPTVNTLPSLKPAPKKPAEAKKVDPLDETNPFLNDETLTNQNLEIDDTKNNPFLNSFDDKNVDSNNPFLNDPVRTNQNPPLESTKIESPKKVSNEVKSNESSQNKSSLNETKEIDILNSSNTSKDLLEWCKHVVKKTKSSSPLFKNLVIENFSTSWMNGLAFCAIIYYFKPESINLKLLNENDPRANLKQAFTASDKESVIRVVDYPDILNKKNLDQLLIMTYLYHMCDHFQPKASKKIAKKSPNNISKLSTIKPKASLNDSKESQSKIKKPQAPTLPNTITKPVESQKGNEIKIKPFNPFDSDDENETKTNETITNKTNFIQNGIIQIKPNGEIVDVNENNVKDIPNEHFPNDLIQSSFKHQRRNSLTNSTSSSSSSLNSSNTNHKDKKTNNELIKPSQTVSSKEVNSSEELIQKAKELLEKNKQTIANQINEDSELMKKEKLKQQAKQIIADTRKNSQKTKKSPSTPRKNSNGNNLANLSLNKDSPGSPGENQSIINDIYKQEELLGTEYVNQEILNLRSKQKELDEQGNNLEKQLRVLMKATSPEKKSDKDKELEDHLLKKWFLLVNEKNALLHRQQELEILQNEKNLEKRYEILSNHLRYLMSIDEFVKTGEQKRTESILMNELISLVNKRNELVIQLDEENKLLNEGEMINEYIQNKETFLHQKEKPCVIQ